MNPTHRHEFLVKILVRLAGPGTAPAQMRLVLNPTSSGYLILKIPFLKCHNCFKVSSYKRLLDSTCFVFSTFFLVSTPVLSPYVKKLQQLLGFHLLRLFRCFWFRRFEALEMLCFPANCLMNIRKLGGLCYC